VNFAHDKPLADGVKTIARRFTAMHNAGHPHDKCKNFVVDQITSFIRPVKTKMKMIDSPEKALICEVILLAIADSLKRGSALMTGVTKELAQRLAIAWLENSPTCENYCALVGINH